jgi:hypothetical protein
MEEKSIKIGSSPLDFLNCITYGNLALHTTIDGGLGSGKTELALEILRQHYDHGGGFCYLSPREDQAVLDAVQVIDANLTAMRRIPDAGTLQGEVTEAITAFIRGENNLFITTEWSPSGSSSPSAILDAMYKISLEARPKNRDDAPRILVIDEADFMSDTSMARLLAVARHAHVAVITIFHCAIQHPATVAQSAVRILMGGLEPESADMWQTLTGVSMAAGTIPIGQAWVLLPDSEVPAIHDVWNGHRHLKAGHTGIPN